MAAERFGARKRCCRHTDQLHGTRGGGAGCKTNPHVHPHETGSRVFQRIERRRCDVVHPRTKPALLARITCDGEEDSLHRRFAGRLERSFPRARCVSQFSPTDPHTLAAAISKDGGKTWLPSKLLENQPDHGYCYTAIAFDGDRVLLGYCAHASRYGLETTQISSFQVQDLYR